MIGQSNSGLLTNVFFLYVLLVFKGLKCDFAGKSMVQSKNLKLKLGLCGLALTSFLAINAHRNGPYDIACFVDNKVIKTSAKQTVVKY